MSGQPVQTTSDQNKFRNEYMENLNLESQIQDMNFQANKVYIQSGQLPPQAQMPDTRSTAEKLKDIEFLKKSIIEELRPIAEPQFALEIYNRVEQHALNIEGGFLRWLAQNGEEFARQLSKKYKIGIAGDINDAEIIVQFLASAYSNIRHSSQSIKSYMSSSTSFGQRSSTMLSINDIDQLIAILQNFKKQMVIFIKKDFQYNNLVSQLIEGLTVLKQCLPTSEELRKIMERIDNQDFINTRESRELMIVLDILKQMPSMDIINTLLYTCEKAIEKNDNQLFTTSFQKIIDLFGFIYNRDTMRALQNFMRQFKTLAQAEVAHDKALESTQLRNEIRAQTDAERGLSKAEKVYVVNPPDDPVNAFLQANALAPNNAVRNVFNAPDVNRLRDVRIAEQIENISLLDDDSLQREYNNGLRQILQNLALDPPVNAPAPNIIRQLIAQAKNILRPLGAYPINPLPTAENIGIMGHGIGQRKGRPRGGSIVITPKKPAFVGFGINEIDQIKLDKNILSIRRNTRSKIKGMGNKHISEPMKRIIKNFIGGSVPNYNDLSSLDNEEKEYLNKIVEHSDLKDRLSVPAPSKDQREKDFHNFEVMKGEILAGNDSKELIKKFKLLMIKLSRQNLLPKSEVQELMEELVELGY